VVVTKNGRNCMANVLVMKFTISSCAIQNFLENTKANRLHIHHFIRTESKNKIITNILKITDLISHALKKIWCCISRCST
jgi:hypothetical protein